MTFELRDMRRRTGLTQMQLADVMNITQSTVSRWESGVEPIRHSKRLELIDLFSNRNGKLDPFVKSLIRRTKDLSVCDFDLNCFAIADNINNVLGVEKTAWVGKNYQHLCESAWFSAVYGDVPVEERVYYEYQHSLVVSGDQFDDIPIRTKQYYFNFENSPGVILSLVSLVSPLEGPIVLNSMDKSALDFT